MSVVGAGVSRVARRDFQLGPYTIPKNTMVWVPVQAMHSSAELWDQPENFMPVSGAIVSACLHPKNAHSKPCESNLVNSPTSGAHASPLRAQERWLEKDAEYWAPPASTSGTNGRTEGAGQQHQQQYKRYMPFGMDGPRICIGMSLAKMTITAVTALLLSRFKFRLADSVGGCFPGSRSPPEMLHALLVIACTPCNGTSGVHDALQMGGLAGRLAAEQSRITVSPHDGMWMHAIPRG